MTRLEIIGELASIYLAGKSTLTLKEARKKAEEKFERSKDYYAKCGFLKKEKDREPVVLPGSRRDSGGLHSGNDDGAD